MMTDFCFLFFKQKLIRVEGEINQNRVDNPIKNTVPRASIHSDDKTKLLERLMENDNNFQS